MQGLGAEVDLSGLGFRVYLGFRAQSPLCIVGYLRIL